MLTDNPASKGILFIFIMQGKV